MGGFDDSELTMSHRLPSASVLDHFSALSDPRQRWRVLYPEILLLVLCATLPGMEDFVEIRLWGEQRLEFPRRTGHADMTPAPRAMRISRHSVRR
jgi:DDE family transposase